MLFKTEFIVLAFCVTSSPVTPSPLVIALTKTPFSYSKFRLAPSNFGSATKVKFSLSPRFSHASSSPRLKISSMLHMRFMWLALLKPSFTPPPTRLVGENSEISLGFACSKAKTAGYSASYSSSLASGSSSS